MSNPNPHSLYPSPPIAVSGFTVIELLVTVTIFGILMAVAMPNLKSMVDNQRLKAATSDVHASLTYARSEAIKRNQFVGVCSKTDDGWGCQNSTDWARGWIVFIDADGNGYPGAISDILKRQDTIPNVTLTGPGGNVSYQKDGRLRGTVSAYVASSAGSTAVAARCVSLDLSGRPNIKTDTDHNPANGCQ